jgi:hypothetical protein
MAKAHWLRGLEMSIAGHQKIEMRLGLLYDGLLHGAQTLAQGAQFVQQEQAHISGHLVVAAATGV